MCGVPVTDYERLPEHRIEEARVIIEARAAAALEIGRRAKAMGVVVIGPEMFAGL